MFKKIVFLSLHLLASASMGAEDLCQLASESIGTTDSDLIAVTKINTTRPALYSARVEASQDCHQYKPLLAVKNPEVIKSGNGLCMVLPAAEIPPNLCRMQLTLCVTKKSCQSLEIIFRKKEGQYVAAEPAYYEMTFQDE